MSCTQSILSRMVYKSKLLNDIKANCCKYENSLAYRDIRLIAEPTLIDNEPELKAVDLNINTLYGLFKKKYPDDEIVSYIEKKYSKELSDYKVHELNNKILEIYGMAKCAVKWFTFFSSSIPKNFPEYDKKACLFQIKEWAARLKTIYDEKNYDSKLRLLDSLVRYNISSYMICEAFSIMKFLEGGAFCSCEERYRTIECFGICTDGCFFITEKNVFLKKFICKIYAMYKSINKNSFYGIIKNLHKIYRNRFMKLALEEEVMSCDVKSENIEHENGVNESNKEENINDNNPNFNDLASCPLYYAFFKRYYTEIRKYGIADRLNLHSHHKIYRKLMFKFLYTLGCQRDFRKLKFAFNPPGKYTKTKKFLDDNNFLISLEYSMLPKIFEMNAWVKNTFENKNVNLIQSEVYKIGGMIAAIGNDFISDFFEPLAYICGNNASFSKNLNTYAKNRVFVIKNILHNIVSIQWGYNKIVYKRLLKIQPQNNDNFKGIRVSWCGQGMKIYTKKIHSIQQLIDDYNPPVFPDLTVPELKVSILNTPRPLITNNKQRNNRQQKNSNIQQNDKYTKVNIPYFGKKKNKRNSKKIKKMKRLKEQKNLKKIGCEKKDGSLAFEVSESGINKKNGNLFSLCESKLAKDTLEKPIINANKNNVNSEKYLEDAKTNDSVVFVVKNRFGKGGYKGEKKKNKGSKNKKDFPKKVNTSLQYEAQENYESRNWHNISKNLQLKLKKMMQKGSMKGLEQHITNNCLEKELEVNETLLLSLKNDQKCINTKLDNRYLSYMKGYFWSYKWIMKFIRSTLLTHEPSHIGKKNKNIGLSAYKNIKNCLKELGLSPPKDIS